MKTMAEVGNKLELPENGNFNYVIHIPEGDYLLITAGVDYDSSAKNFDSDKILRSRKKVFNFKHYRKGGGKSWTSRPGFEFLFAIPKDKIYMAEKRGHSYVYIEIDGMKYTLNVSGGGGKIWEDFVTQGSSVGVFQSQKGLKKLAENAIIPENIDLGPVRPMDIHETEEFNRLCAYYDTKKKLHKGSVVYLKERYLVKASHGPFDVYERPKGKRHFVCVDREGYKIQVNYKHIDWVETAHLNNVNIAS